MMLQVKLVLSLKKLCSKDYRKNHQNHRNKDAKVWETHFVIIWKSQFIKNNCLDMKSHKTAKTFSLRIKKILRNFYSLRKVKVTL